MPELVLLIAAPRMFTYRIDNNEFSGLTDDGARFKGDVTLGSEGSPGDKNRTGWHGGPVTVGQAGKLAQAMGMAKVLSSVD